VTDAVGNLILRPLPRIKQGVQDVKLRLTAVEEHMLSIQASVVGLNSPVDRFDERLSRAGRRFELTDHN